MDTTKCDISNVIQRFITAVEETKELLKSPSVPGKPCCFCLKPQRKMGIAGFSSLSSESDPGTLHQICSPSEETDEIDFAFEHTLQERQAQGLVTEMDSLLTQISSAANSLKTIYLRRSSTDCDVGALKEERITTTNTMELDQRAAFLQR